MLIYIFRICSEKDIEEILFQHTRTAPCSHFLSGRCHPRSTSPPLPPSGRKNPHLGLLREACCLSAGRPARVRKDQENNCEPPDTVAAPGRNTVVTFDLNVDRKITSPLRPAKNGILKREKSM